MTNGPRRAAIAKVIAANVGAVRSLCLEYLYSLQTYCVKHMGWPGLVKSRIMLFATVGQKTD